MNQLIEAYSRIAKVTHYHDTGNTTLIALRYLKVKYGRKINRP